jgi:hypothetical protein
LTVWPTTYVPSPKVANFGVVVVAVAAELLVEVVLVELDDELPHPAIAVSARASKLPAATNAPLRRKEAGQE